MVQKGKNTRTNVTKEQIRLDQHTYKKEEYSDC